jgi:hypothetical protein
MYGGCVLGEEFKQLCIFQLFNVFRSLQNPRVYYTMLELFLACKISSFVKIIFEFPRGLKLSIEALEFVKSLGEFETIFPTNLGILITVPLKELSSEF